MNDTLPQSADQMTDILDIEGLLQSPLARFLENALIAAIVVLALILLWYLAKAVLRRLRSQNADDVLLPHKRALLELERLQRQRFIERQEWQRFYFFMTEIFKHYLHDRFNLDVLDKTKEELQTDFVMMGSLAGDDNNKRGLEDFLNRSELIKFAKQSSSLQQCEQDLVWLKEFIQKSHKNTESAPNA